MPDLFVNAIVVLPDRLAFGTIVVVEGDRIVAVRGPQETIPGGKPIDLGGAYLAPGSSIFTSTAATATISWTAPTPGFAPYAKPTLDTARPVSCRRQPSPGTSSTLRCCRYAASFSIARRAAPAFRGPFLRSLFRSGGSRLSPDFDGAAAQSRGIRRIPHLRRRDSPRDGGARITRRRGVCQGLPDTRHRRQSWPFARHLFSGGGRARLGRRHVDHLFCAMSDRARLRQSQTYPMRGGLMEATLYFDDLTTEVIADGKHLDSSLLKLAYKAKGAEPPRPCHRLQPGARLP